MTNTIMITSENILSYMASLGDKWFIIDNKTFEVIRHDTGYKVRRISRFSIEELYVNDFYVKKIIGCDKTGKQEIRQRIMYQDNLVYTTDIDGTIVSLNYKPDPCDLLLDLTLVRGNMVLIDNKFCHVEINTENQEIIFVPNESGIIAKVSKDQIKIDSDNNLYLEELYGREEYPLLFVTINGLKRSSEV